MNETILGLDLSTVATGYCVAKDGKIIHYDTIKSHPKLHPLEKIIHMVEETQKLVVKYKVDELIIEDIYFAFIKSFLRLAELRGAVVYMWYKMKLRIPISYRPVTARKIMSVKTSKEKIKGKKRRGITKKEVLERVNELLNKNIKDHNVADAIILVLAYLKENK